MYEILSCAMSLKGVGQVVEIILFAFLAILLLLLFVGLIMKMMDSCCGTELLWERPKAYSRNGERIRIDSDPIVISHTITSHTFDTRPAAQSTQYTFRNETESHDTSGTTFTGEADFDLPMCDPLQAYPMPAPEHRGRSASGSASVPTAPHRNERYTANTEREGAASRSDGMSEDLPPSYDEAVKGTKATKR